MQFRLRKLPIDVERSQHMARVLYGYRMSGGVASIHAAEACIVISILTFPAGKRMRAVRTAAQIVNFDIPESTLKTMIYRVLKRREYYATGRVSLDQPPRPDLKLI